MDVHDGFVGATQAMFDQAHQADLDLQDTEGVSFDQAWLDPEAGKVFCLSTGPSKAAVLRVHQRAGHPTEEIYELPVEAH